MATTPTSTEPEDWGASDGAHLAIIREKHGHHRSERKFQLWVVGIFTVLVLALVIIQALVPAISAKDITLVALPVFTFVLGKLDHQRG